MKIKKQTRKLTVGFSKQCFEVADKTDEVSNHIYGKATLTWFEEIFEEYNRKSSYYFVVLRVSVSFLSFNSSVISDACATSLLWVTTMTHLPVF